MFNFREEIKNARIIPIVPNPILIIFLVVGPVLASGGGPGALQPLHDLHHGSLHHEAQGRVQVQDGVRLSEGRQNCIELLARRGAGTTSSLRFGNPYRVLAFFDVSDEDERRGC